MATNYLCCYDEKKKILEAAQPYEQNLASHRYNKKLTYAWQSAEIQKQSDTGETSYGLIHNIVKLKTYIGKCFFCFHQNMNFIKPFIETRWSLATLKSLVDSHNNILKDQPQCTLNICSCLKKRNCPMNGLCLTESLMCYTTITCDKQNYTKQDKRIYETTSKKHFGSYKKSSNFPTYRNETKFSIKHWALKIKHLNPKLSW